jgi:hypothetical protein
MVFGQALGGVPRVVVFDNASSAVKQKDAWVAQIAVITHVINKNG